MDTDDLTTKTYNAILGEAEKFHSDLTLQFGLLSYDCNNETEFIKKSEALIGAIKKYNKADISDMFFGDPPSINDLRKALDKILSNISALKKDE
jgi:hypothetical protein